MAEAFCSGCLLLFEVSSDSTIAVCPSCGDDILSDQENPTLTRDSRFPSRLQLSRPASFSGFRLDGVLGRGGMGVVYRAWQEELGRPVALKMLHDAQGETDSEVDRLLREARLAASLEHPNIVKVFDVGQQGERHFFTMQLIDGESLRDRLKREGPLTSQVAARLLIPIARAVGYAHQQRVIHRDLKPSNVILDAEGTPYVMDFGLARSLENHSGRTETGDVLGTPAYMPPEQIRGAHRDVDERSDIYALGAILYQCLTGYAPFLANNLVEYSRLILEEEPVAPRRLSPSVAPDLQAITVKALSKTKADRYPTAEAFADELERFVSGEPVSAGHSGPWTQSLHWLRRYRVPVAAVLVLSILVGGYGYWTESSRIHSTRTQMDLARTAMNGGQLEQALEALARADVFSPGDPEIHQLRAQVHLDKAERLLDLDDSTGAWSHLILAREYGAGKSANSRLQSLTKRLDGSGQLSVASNAPHAVFHIRPYHSPFQWTLLGEGVALDESLEAGDWVLRVTAENHVPAHVPFRMDREEHQRLTVRLPEDSLDGAIYVAGGELHSRDLGSLDISPFFISAVPVTHREYKVFMDATGHRSPKFWHDDRVPEGREELPVIHVDHDDARAFAAWKGGRLPTEAQWRFAAYGLVDEIPAVNPVEDVSLCPFPGLSLPSSVSEWTDSPGGSKEAWMLLGGRYHQGQCLPRLYEMEVESPHRSERIGFRWVIPISNSDSK